MDDNKAKEGENQLPQPVNTPIFETVTQDKPETPQPIATPPPQPEPDMQPEEIAEDVATPEQAAGAVPPPPPSRPPAMFSPLHYMKYFILGGGVALFIFIFFLLFKLLTGAGVSSEPITLRYWGLWEDAQIYAPLIQEYQAKNKNIRIDYQKMSPQEYRQKLLARKENGPDIFRFHNTWVPEMKDILTAIPSSVMTNAEFEKTFYPIAAKDLKVSDHYFGIPLQIDSLVLVYNNSLFKKAGITKAPVTWEEITTDIQKLLVKDKSGTITVSSIALGTASNIEHFSDIFGLMLLQNGGSLEKLDQPEAAQTLQAYRAFAEPPKDFWNESMPNSIAAFIQEKVAMIIVPSWEILAIKAANPDLDLKVTSVPRLPGAQPMSVATYWVEGVSIHSKHQIEAWKFLKFLSQKENMTHLYELESKTRIFGEPYSRVDLASTITQNPYIGPVIQQANTLVSIPTVSRTFDSGLNDTINKYLENAINTASQGVSYSEAMRVASQGVSQAFSTYVQK